jgi:hypothetical protein
VRLASIPVIAVVATLGWSAAASAATLCVQMPPATPCSATYLTLQGAIDAAQAAYPSTRDTIRVGPVTLAPEAAEVLVANPVDIVGSGRTATRLQSLSTAPSAAALTISGPSTVSELGIAVGDVPGAFSSEDGLDLRDGASASGISITAVAGMDNATGVHVRSGSTLRDSSVEMPLGLANAAVRPGAGAVLEDLSLVAEVGVDMNGAGEAVARRIVTPSPVQEAVRVRNGGVLDLSDSLLRILDDDEATGVVVSGFADGSISARNLTVIGSGEGIGADVFAPAAAIDLRDSILHGMTTSIRRGGAGTPTVTVSYSNFDAATFDESLATEGGSIAQGAGNLNVNPLFRSAGDFHLDPSSPLVDSGFPGDGPSATDLDGAARVTDGNGDGIARRDIGAFEYQRPPAPLPGGSPPPKGALPPVLDVTRPVLSKLSLSRRVFRVARGATPRTAARKRSRPTPAGTRVRYTLSEAATVRFVIQWQVAGRKRYKAAGALVRKAGAGANRLAFTGRVGRRRLVAGRYRLNVTATDPAGNRSKVKRVAFRIVRR